MTVSPRWPHDDSATSSADDHPLAADSGADSNMPPTLFRLPNLNTAPRNPGPELAPTIPVDDAAQTAVADPFDNTVQSQPITPATPPVAISPAAADAVAVDTQPPDRLQHGGAQLPDAISSHGFHERPATINDMPAGRSWMEVARQHGVVVMLLLIVVATAIFTGREPSRDLTDDAIADAIDMGQIDMKQIDQGIASNIPMPAHIHDSETGVAASQTYLDPAQDDVDSISLALDSVAQTNDGVTSSNDASTSFASLEPPQRSAAQEPTGVHANETTADVANTQDSLNEVAGIDFVPPQVDARTVANRVASTTEVDSDVAFNPPSLESLAEALSDGDSELGDNLNRVQANSFVPISSKTPNGISDWLNYLPALPNDTSN